jgi:hypothetical protein
MGNEPAPEHEVRPETISGSSLIRVRAIGGVSRSMIVGEPKGLQLPNPFP